MTALGLLAGAFGYLLIMAGFKGENPLDVLVATFTGRERPAPSLRINTAASSGSSGSGEPGKVLGPMPGTSGQIVEWNGAKLDASIMPKYQAMIAAAAADGVVLRPGSTFRSNAEQIALRKAHCGAGWATAPASSCSPPTARPGESMHERGLAIDFANLSAAGFNWLRANAARFGFYNLPSERWHWSTNGK